MTVGRGVVLWFLYTFCFEEDVTAMWGARVSKDINALPKEPLAFRVGIPVQVRGDTGHRKWLRGTPRVPIEHASD
jgi:hypothetical protein